MAALLAVFFGAAAVQSAADVAKLRGETAEAEATVVEVVGWRAKSVVLEFTTASGENVEAKTSDFAQDPMPEPGSRLRIVYVPDEPWLVAEAGAVPDYFLPIWIGVLATVCAAGSALGFRGRVPGWLTGDG